MKYFVNLVLAAFLLFALTGPRTGQADRTDDIDRLLNWAEVRYPELFAPASQSTQVWDIWTYRYYPATDNYAGVNESGEVWVMGADFGDLTRIDTLENLLAQIDDSTECAQIPLPENGRMAMWEIVNDTDPASVFEFDRILRDMKGVPLAQLWYGAAAGTLTVSFDDVSETGAATWSLHTASDGEESMASRYDTWTIADDTFAMASVSRSEYLFDEDSGEESDQLNQLTFGVSDEALLAPEVSQVSIAPWQGYPASRFCVGHVWNAPAAKTNNAEESWLTKIDPMTGEALETLDYKGTLFDFGLQSNQLGRELRGQVLAVNENVTAGGTDYNTVRIRIEYHKVTTDGDAVLAWSDIWTDTETGVMVRQATYDGNGNSLNSAEAMLIL